MRWRLILNFVGILIFALGLSMTLPLVAGIIYKDRSVIPILCSMIVSVLTGIIIFYCCRAPKTDQISTREGMAIVAFSWIFAALFGSLPFYFGDAFPNFVDCLFESVSGFTTTGASVLNDIEAVPKGLLLWRSLIQWLGGMGIIVLSIAVLPFLGVGGMQLYKAEVPSPVPDKLKPRISETAKILWNVYLLFTAAEVLLLMFGGMNFFDAICHALTTMPTGGFSTKNASIAAFDSIYLHGIIIFFMLIVGINFSLHYQLLRGKPLAFWRDPECRFFLCVIFILTIVVTLNIYGQAYDKIDQAFRHGCFQVVSIVTTTGYVTADYEKWPAMSQVILLFCMFLGASAGSTGGGMKCVRIMLCFKYCYKVLFSMIHPHSVTNIKIGGKTVPEDVTRSVLGFLVLYIGLFVICTIIMAGLGIDFVTALGSVASSIGNIGPGFGMVGPVENYAQIPYLGKWVLIWCMLLGRLEIYTVIILLVPEFWRK